MSYTTRRMGFGYITERERERQEEAAEHRSQMRHDAIAQWCDDSIAAFKAACKANPQLKVEDEL